MGVLTKMEKKLGRFAVRHLMRYVLALYIIGYIVQYISIAISNQTGIEHDIYSEYLMLDIDKLLQGQVWRLFTFLIQPPGVSVLFLIFFLYLYYMIGEALENVWGSFMFNLYFISGVLFNILAVVGIYVVSKIVIGYGISFPITLDYINQSLFLAFAVLYPNTQLLLFFFIPIKIRWLGIIEAVLMGYQVIKYVFDGVHALLDTSSAMNVITGTLSIAMGVSIVVAMANFIIFYFIFKRHRFNPSILHARAQFRRSVERARRESGQTTSYSGFAPVARHKCAICGRTEKDDDTLEFRYCTKCVGNYEYCLEHLYTHTHVGGMVNLDKSNDGGQS